MSNVSALKNAIYGNGPRGDQYLKWLQSQGTDKKNPADCIDDLLSTYGFTSGKRSDQMKAWIEYVTGKPYDNFNNNLIYAMERGLVSFGEHGINIADFFYHGQKCDENGVFWSRQGKEQRDPVTGIKVPKGNGSDTEITITGFTQTVNDVKPLIIELNNDFPTSANVETICDTRYLSGVNQNTGVRIAKHSDDTLNIVVISSSGNFRQYYFPLTLTGVHRRLEIYTSSINFYENGSSVTVTSNVETGTITDFTASNDIVLLQRGDKTNAQLCLSELSDFKIKNGLDEKWERILPLQETDGDKVYCAVTGTAYTATNPNWTTPTIPTTYWINKKGGSGYYKLDGAGDYVQANYMAAAIKAAIESVEIDITFFSSDISTDYQTLFGGNTSAGGNALSLFLTPGRNAQFKDGQTGAITWTEYDFQDSTWYRIKVIADITNSTGSMYVNGNLISTKSETWTDIVDTDQVSIGQEFDTLTVSDEFSQYIRVNSIKADGVEIYDRSSDTLIADAFFFYCPAKQDELFDALGNTPEYGPMKYGAQAYMLVPEGNGTDIYGLMKDIDSDAFDWNDFKLFGVFECVAHATVSQVLFDSRDGSGLNGFQLAVIRSDHPTFPDTLYFAVFDGANTRSRSYSLPTYGQVIEVSYDGSAIVMKYDSVAQSGTLELSDTITEFVPNKTDLSVGVNNGVTASYFRERMSDIKVGRQSETGWRHYFTMTGGYMDSYIDMIGGTAYIEMYGVSYSSGLAYSDKCLFYEMQFGYNKCYISDGVNDSLKWDNFATNVLGQQLTSSDTLVIKFWYHLIEKTSIPDVFANIIFSLDQPNSTNCFRVGHDDNSTDLWIVASSNFNWNSPTTPSMDEGIHEFTLTLSNDSLTVRVVSLDGSEDHEITFSVNNTSLGTELDFWLLSDPDNSGNPTDVPSSWVTLPHLCTLNDVDLTQTMRDNVTKVGTLKDGLIGPLYGQRNSVNKVDPLSEKIQYGIDGALETDQIQINMNKDSAEELTAISAPTTYNLGDGQSGSHLADVSVSGKESNHQLHQYAPAGAVSTYIDAFLNK